MFSFACLLSMVLSPHRTGGFDRGYLATSGLVADRGMRSRFLRRFARIKARAFTFSNRGE
jgi:hypothetical protein